MSLRNVRSLAGLLVLAVALVPMNFVAGQGKEKKSKDITITTYDGVELSGTFYPNVRKDATVLILHHFDGKKGSSTDSGWSELAEALYGEGYAVLSFDFRGYGQSKTLVPELFWKFKHNTDYVRKKGKGETIEHGSYGPAYQPYLLNDIAAAKAYLDRANDRKECNTSSLIVVGAGNGASLGAAWMANETKRRKDKNMVPFGVPIPSETPESKDLAAGVWLSPTGVVPGPNRAIDSFVFQTAKTQRIPMIFYVGSNDSTGVQVADRLIGRVKPKGDKSKEFALTLKQEIKGAKVTGNGLLDKDTIAGVKKYIDAVLEARGSQEWKERKVEASTFLYGDPKKGGLLPIDKKPGEPVAPVDVRRLLNPTP